MRKFLFFMLFIPLCTVGQVKKGNELYNNMDYSKALKYYLNDVENADNIIRYEAVFMLSDCYIKINNTEEAIKWLTELKRFDASKPEVHYKLGCMLQRNGEYEKAFKEFEAFNAIEPTPASLAYASYCQNIDKLPADVKLKFKAVTSVNTENSDFSPVVFNGQLLFTSDRNSKIDGVYGWTNFGYCKEYSAKLTDQTNIFDFPEKPNFTRDKQINQNLHSGPLSVSENGKRYFLTRTVARKGKKNKDKTVYLSLIYGDIIDGDFEDPKEFPYNNANYNVAHASLSPDGSSVIFSSQSPSGYGEGDLYISYYRNETWTQPENLGDQINDFGNEVFPQFVDESTLVFSSNSHFGYGGLDCFITTKDANGNWSTPSNMGAPINSSYDDFGIYLLKDGTQGYVCSDRPGGQGADDIYAFKKEDELPLEQTATIDIVPALYKKTPNNVKAISSTNDSQNTIKSSGFFYGRVLNQTTNKPVDHAMVFVLHPNTHNVNVYETAPDGTFQFDAKTNELLVFHAMKDDCTETIYQFRIPEEESWNQQLPKDLFIKEGGLNSVAHKTTVYYNLNKDNLRNDAQQVMRKLVNYIRHIEGDYKIYIDSHTDVRSSTKYNNDLSWRRAQNAMKYLVDYDIPSRKITIDWHGEENPQIGRKYDVGMAEEMHQRNRRTTITVEHMKAEHYTNTIDLSLYQAGDVLPMEIFPTFFFNTMAKGHEVE